MADEHQLLSELLPSYELGGEIGRGGWGVVFEAEHVTLERRVAIKHLPGAFGADPSARDRFRSEARVVASLDHPHIVPLYDFVERGDTCVFVMEHMPGGTLWDRFEGDGLGPEAACAVTLAMLGALHHAHEHGVLHRDVKPENVLFNSTGRPKLADFGIAKVLGDGAGTRTATGTIMGTPAYMAPEQGSGAQVSPATDVYAVGVMLYELLSGRLPFESTGNALSQLYRHVYEAPAALAEVAPSVHPALSTAVMRALAKEPAERHESAAAFATALDVAASTALGEDWAAQSGVPILATRAVLGQTGRGPIPVVDPTPPPSAPPAPAPPAQPSPAPLAAAPAVATTPPGAPVQPAATSAPPSSPGAHPAPQPAPTPAPAVDRPGGGRKLLAGVLGIGVVVAIAIAALALSGGDDPDDDTAAPAGQTTVSEPAFDSAAARDRLERACNEAEEVDENGEILTVPDELCDCAVEAAWEELSEDDLRANDELIRAGGFELTAEVDEVFDRCAGELGLTQHS